MLWIGMLEGRPREKTLKTIPRLYFFGSASHLFICGVLLCIVREQVTDVCCLDVEKRNMKIQNATSTGNRDTYSISELNRESNISHQSMNPNLL